MLLIIWRACLRFLGATADQSEGSFFLISFQFASMVSCRLLVCRLRIHRPIPRRAKRATMPLVVPFIFPPIEQGDCAPQDLLLPSSRLSGRSNPGVTQLTLDPTSAYRPTTDRPVCPYSKGRRRITNYRITVHYPSGAIEHIWGGILPEVGDKFGRSGDAGFVTSVEREEDGPVRVRVGTRVPTGVTWSDATATQPDGRATVGARERILEAAYDLFSRRGLGDVGIDELIERAGVAKSTFYRHFRSKDDLVLAFLQRREHRWTRELVEAGARSRGATPRERLLAIFDVFDEWFHRHDFEGCSFINVLLETADLHHPVGRASAAHLEYIRSIVRQFAEEAGVLDAEAFAHSFHMLMKGSIVAAGEGDTLAAKRAKSLAELLLDDYLQPATSSGGS